MFLLIICLRSWIIYKSYQLPSMGSHSLTAARQGKSYKRTAQTNDSEVVFKLYTLPADQRKPISPSRRARGVIEDPRVFYYH